MRGRGFDSSPLAVIQEVTYLTSACACSGTHQDSSMGRMEHDAKDIQSVIEFFIDRKPFCKDLSELRSLTTGIIAEKTVNVDSAEAVDSSIFTSMVWMSVGKHKFSKKDQVNTLVLSVYLSIDGEKIKDKPKTAVPTPSCCQYWFHRLRHSL